MAEHDHIVCGESCLRCQEGRLEKSENMVEIQRRFASCETGFVLEEGEEDGNATQHINGFYNAVWLWLACGEVDKCVDIDEEVENECSVGGCEGHHMF